MNTGVTGFQLEIDGAVACLTIDRAEKRNAVTLEMWRALPGLLDRVAASDESRVLIVTGAGDRCFCAGNDITEFKDVRSTPEQVAHYHEITQKAYAALKTVPLPTIAKIRGFCIGGGLEVSQLCDLQVAAADATFAVTPAKLGLGYKLDDVLLLTGTMLPKRAKELLFTGAKFSADDALAMGLVNRVATADDLDGAVEALAQEIAGNAPLSLKAAKFIVEEAAKDRADRDLSLAAQLVDACDASSDYKEGQAAFREKRKPRFTGT